ncbi:MAG TPA: helix-turn-helix domain-containing protein [Candidatus Didemnitutus sp.]|nr:helix-turn-helix domain-containing protein [Candidatus Didemnitutus sp.]
MNIATVNIADAQLVHPIAMEHARGVLDHEMKMLTSGIKKKARIEFLVAARRRMTAEAPVVVPSALRQIMSAQPLSEFIARQDEENPVLRGPFTRSTFRDLRSARRRLGIRTETADPYSISGALLVLAQDEEATEVLQRLMTPLMEHLASSPTFHDANQEVNAIMSRPDSADDKQRRVAEIGIALWPVVFETMPEWPAGAVRDLAYLRGMILDQDIMKSLSAIIGEIGTDFLDDHREAMMNDSVESYRVVLSAIINERLEELGVASEPETGHVSRNITASAPAKASSVEPAPENRSFDALPLMLTMDETAKLLRVTRMTIHRRLKDGSLEGRHVGVNHLILTESVKKYLDVEKKSRTR